MKIRAGGGSFRAGGGNFRAAGCSPLLFLFVGNTTIDNLCKKFGHRSGSTNLGPDLDPNHFDTLVVVLK